MMMLSDRPYLFRRDISFPYEPAIVLVKTAACGCGVAGPCEQHDDHVSVAATALSAFIVSDYSL